jgi:serine/threonine protein phosphatase PrpC
MHPIGIGLSDVGRVRERNEDSLLVDDDLGLYVVSDGMGGHVGGDLASSIAVTAVAREIGSQRRLLREMAGSEIQRDPLEALASQAVLRASRAIVEAAEGTRHEGMGCTLTMLLIVGNKAVMAHVGDSRLYLCRDHKVSQLSTDHTMANELAIAGIISQQAIQTHQYAHVLTRALGSDGDLQVDTLVMDILPGDRFVICSDGLGDYIDSEEWLRRQLDAAESDALPEELVSYANAAGGQDNITVVVARIEADAPDLSISDEMSIEVQGKFDALESVFLFEGLSMALLTRVLNCCVVDDYRKGDVVVTESQPMSQLMVVVEGRFEVSHDGIVDGELGPGDHIGATTLLSPRRSRASLQASRSGRLLILQRDPFWKLIRQRPWLGVGLLERLGRQLSQDLDRSIEQREESTAVADTVTPHERF